jgi:hypothetical protein
MNKAMATNTVSGTVTVSQFPEHLRPLRHASGTESLDLSCIAWWRRWVAVTGMDAESLVPPIGGPKTFIGITKKFAFMGWFGAPATHCTLTCTYNVPCAAVA